MSLEDAQQTRLIRHELTRRYVDTTNVDVRVIHGVCYLRGSIEKLRSNPDVDLEHEAEVINKVIRGIRGVRDVVWDVRTGTKRLNPHMLAR